MSDAAQLSLDSYVERLSRPTPPVTTQDAHLRRVSGAIGEAVLRFCRAHLGKEFRGAELLAAVIAECGPVAPDSPRRVLCALQRDGVVAYRVVSRAESLYCVEAC